MSEAISILEAVAIDATHLELREPLPQRAGKNFKIAILAASQNHEQLFDKLKRAYLTMTTAEKNFEVRLAEEGLANAPALDFENSEAEKWWE